MTPNDSPFGKKSGETEPLRNPDSNVIFLNPRITASAGEEQGKTEKKKKRKQT